MYRMFLHLRRFAICFSLLASYFSACAPSRKNEGEMPLVNLQAFDQPTKNWVIVADVESSPTAIVPTTKAGTGVLFNDFDEKDLYKPTTNIVTKSEYGDIKLSLDFLVPKGSNSGIYFQGRYEIQIFDSWGVKEPKASDCGGIYERWDEARPEGKKGFEGHPPMVNASLPPGEWQHLEAVFKAPRFDNKGKKVKPAQFESVILNRVLIHKNVPVNGPTRSAKFEDEKQQGPLMFQGDHGPVAFKNISIRTLR